MNFIKISFMCLVIIFLNGCIQSTALLGPGLTVATTGNIVQAGLQYGANSAIKKETGKDTLEHLKDVVEKKDKDKYFKLKFKRMVEKRIEITKQKLALN
jgi:hypothetical protein